jgi:hypothetical protein
MDFGKAFSFTFEDPDWVKKVLLGGVISLVPILNFASTGYSLEVTRRVIHNDPRPLPEWDDIGGKLVKGLVVAVIGFIYALPLTLMNCILQVAMPMLAQSGSSSSGDQMNTAVVALASCLGCLMFLYGIFMGFVLPAAIGNYAAKDQFGAAFRFGEIFGLVQKNLSVYLLVLVIELISGLVAVLGIIACVIGVAFTGFWALLVNGFATGQAYREASANIGLV